MTVLEHRYLAIDNRSLSEVTMMWEPRTLDALRLTDPRRHPDGDDLVVHVNRQEALLLHQAGATVASSGCRFSEGRGTQQYAFEGKTYFWLSGFGSSLTTPDDEYPVLGAVDARMRELMEESRIAD